jgi:hypothetical protein
MKIIISISLLFFSLLFFSLFSGYCQADGKVEISHTREQRGSVANVIFAFTGDATTGSMPEADVPAEITNKLKEYGYFLYRVKAFPTPGGIAPDAADVDVIEKGIAINESDKDLVEIKPAVPRNVLGDFGANLIHDTDLQEVEPLQYEPVNGTFSVKVTNQATPSANATVILVFVR